MRRINDISTSSKRELLEILSAWLLVQLEPTSRHAEAERLGGCAMAEWLQLQVLGAQLQTEESGCRARVAVAQQEYNQLAPLGQVGLGIIDQWFAEPTKKAQIEKLGQTLGLNNSELLDVSTKLYANISERRKFGKKFLRGCMSNIDQLENETVFGERAQELVREITQSIGSTWNDLVLNTNEAFQAVDSDMSSLRSLYR